MKLLCSSLTYLLMLWTLVFCSNLYADNGLAEKIQQAQHDQKSRKISNLLIDIKDAFEQSRSQVRSDSLAVTHDSSVAVEILFTGDKSRAIEVLVATGMKNIVATATVISGSIALEVLNDIEQHDFIKTVRYNKVLTRSGSVVSEGVKATTSASIPSIFNVTGRDVRVGVISDSYNCLGGEQADIASGDIPDGVQVLSEIEDCTVGTDEGRALIQIVYDFASDAEFTFGSGVVAGANEVAALINSMVNNFDVDIIVDDTSSLQDSFFQDNAVSVAIEDAVSQGVSYVVSAGNAGDLSYEGLFSQSYDPILDLMAHDFDAGDEVSRYQKLTIPTGELLEIVLQWDEPAYSVSGGLGAESDLDIFLLSSDGSVLYESAAENNLGQDPIEILSFINDESLNETQFQLLIVHAQGRTPGLVKYIIPSRFTGSIDDYYAPSSTIVGRANSAGSISVGATPYDLTTEFGHFTNEVRFFSSVGGVPILFDSSGSRIPNEFRVRFKPDLTAPDGINTTFFNGDDTDNDGLPNFLGTSASAPHAAGIIALMLEAAPELNPAQIQHILQSTATDIVSSDGEELPLGFDFTSGYGLINGAAAVGAAIAWSPDTRAPLQSNIVYALFESIRPSNDNLNDFIDNTTDGESTQSEMVTVGGSISLIALLGLLLMCLVVVVRRKPVRVLTTTTN